MKVIAALVLALVISIGINFYQWNHPRTITEKGKTVYIPPVENHKIDAPPAAQTTIADGSHIVTVQGQPVYKDKAEKAEVLKQTVDAIPTVKKPDIASVTITRANLDAQFSDKDLVLDDKVNGIKKWQKKYNSITQNSKTDSIRAQSEVSPKVVVTDKKAGFLRPKVPYIVIASPNPAISFDGASTYEIKAPQYKKTVELVLDAALQKNFVNSQISFNPQLQLQFNPNGNFRPYVFIGTEGNTPTWKFYPYYGLGAQYLIFGL